MLTVSKSATKVTDNEINLDFFFFYDQTQTE